MKEQTPAALIAPTPLLDRLQKQKSAPEAVLAEELEEEVWAEIEEEAADISG